MQMLVCTNQLTAVLAGTKLAGVYHQPGSGKATLQMYKGNPNYIYANIANDITAYVGYYKKY